LWRITKIMFFFSVIWIVIESFLTSQFRFTNRKRTFLSGDRLPSARCLSPLLFTCFYLGKWLWFISIVLECLKFYVLMIFILNIFRGESVMKINSDTPKVSWNLPPFYLQVNCNGRSHTWIE
jgi:hypothetical protein